MQTNNMKVFAVPSAPTLSQRGFTLIELAIVMFIVSLLIGGMLLPLSAQQDIRNDSDTQKTLANARDALLGYATAYGRLPCPAWDGSGADSTNTLGRESFAAGGTTINGLCGHFYEGFLPAAELGLLPVDNQGFLLDAWSRRIHYAVSKDPTISTMSSNADVNPRYSFTMTDGMKTISMASLHPDLHVCNAGPATGTAQCTGTALATTAVLTVFSTGKNAGTGGTGTDEATNVIADRVFVSHTQTAAGAPNGEFDDLVIWLSPNILFNRMVAAGRLP